MESADDRVAAGDPSMSVIISVYTEDRWEDILACVYSVAGQTVSPLEVIVVVDHNPGLLARLRARLPHVAVVENRETRGLSGARNSGVDAAAGDIVAFLDDDAVAAPEWLEHLALGYRNERVVGVGGSIEPLWFNRRPRAFPAEFDWVVGCTYRGMPNRTSRVRNTIGANMSFRRKIFSEVGGFQCGIGRVGTRPVGCEETEFCIRACRGRPEAIILYEPRAQVHHRVPSNRARPRYFASRCYSEGLSKATVARLAGARDGLASERAYTLRTLPRGVARGLGDAVLHGDAAGLGRAGAIVAGLGVTTAGYVVGWLLGVRRESRTLRGAASA